MDGYAERATYKGYQIGIVNADCTTLIRIITSEELSEWNGTPSLLPISLVLKGFDNIVHRFNGMKGGYTCSNTPLKYEPIDMSTVYGSDLRCADV